ncbi:MAG: cytochrome c [Ignavibacteria bacterium]|nr:cytochrome c [Ignavibacteria bacterium]
MEHEKNTKGFGFYLKIVIGLGISGFVVGVLSGSITWFSEDPPIMIINDMDDQFKVKPQVGSSYYTDRKSGRDPLPNTVPIQGTAYPLDKPDFEKADSVVGANPLDISTPEKRQYILSRGKNRYEAFCTPCHNYDGQGNGAVVKRGFQNPPNLRDSVTKAKTDAHIFHIISAGQNIMNGYGDKIKPHDRWTVVHYIREMQKLGMVK